MKKYNHKNLKIYQRTIKFAVEIYKLSKVFSKDELLGLTNQIRRTVASISFNITKGSGNKSEKEFQRFFEMALCSNYEIIISGLYYLCNL